jgi:hypothetical protein
VFGLAVALEGSKVPAGIARRITYKLLMNRTPKRYISRAPMRMPRKTRRVTGCALRRQFKSPCCGCGLSGCCSILKFKY